MPTAPLYRSIWAAPYIGFLAVALAFLASALYNAGERLGEGLYTRDTLTLVLVRMAVALAAAWLAALTRTRATGERADTTLPQGRRVTRRIVVVPPRS